MDLVWRGPAGGAPQLGTRGRTFASDSDGLCPPTAPPTGLDAVAIQGLASRTVIICLVLCFCPRLALPNNWPWNSGYLSPFFIANLSNAGGIRRCFPAYLNFTDSQILDTTPMCLIAG